MFGALGWPLISGTFSSFGLRTSLRFTVSYSVEVCVASNSAFVSPSVTLPLSLSSLVSPSSVTIPFEPSPESVILCLSRWPVTGISVEESVSQRKLPEILPSTSFT